MVDNTSQSPASPTTGNLIYQQIEQTADYYLPSVYQNLLTFHHSLELQTDAVGQQFIPISDAINNPDQKKKLFVVGLIPPSSQVTGRMLDRSNSVASLSQGSTSTSGNDQLTGQLTANDPSAGSVNIQGTPGSNQGPPIWTQMSVQQMASAINDAYTNNPNLPQPPNANAIAMMVGQSLRETSGRWPNYNPGFIGNYPPGDPILNSLQTFGVFNRTEGGVTQYYVSYNSPQSGAAAFVGAILRTGGQAAITAASNGDVQGYCQALHDGGYYTASVDFYAGNYPNVQSLASQIGDPSSLNTSGLPAPMVYGPKGQIDPSTSGNWASSGSDASASSTEMTAKGGNLDLNNTTNTGYQFQQQQRAMVLATQQLLQQMANTPPLQLMVNPQSFRTNAEKIISDGNWTRYGPADVVEHWGDNQDKIEGSGRIAAFQAVDLTNDNGGPGLTRTARQYSASYQNFLSLYQLYRNNAGLFLVDNVEPTDTKKQNMSVLGSIYLYFDHTIYIGSFDNFTITETDTAPYTLEYNFSFSVRATFTLDQVTDPNYTYGIPSGGFTVQQPITTPTSQSQTLSSGTPPSDAQNTWDQAFTDAINGGASITDAGTAANNAAQQALVGNLTGGGS